LKILARSFFTKWDKKKIYLDEITFDARKLAVERGLNFAFYTILSKGRGSKFSTLAKIDRAKSLKNRSINIIFFSRVLMDSEKEIKVTIFHEYCHFLYAYADPLHSKIKKFYHSGRFPNRRNSVEEDFCDLFGYYIVDNDTGDQEIDSFLEEYIHLTYQIITNDPFNGKLPLERNNWMKKYSDMSETYFEPYYPLQQK